MEELTYDTSLCMYCFNAEDIINLPCLTCDKCQKIAHLECLRSSGFVSNLLGDVFFDFVCLQCSPNNMIQISRDKLPWYLAIVLTLYNMSYKSMGISNHGYFHWKTHIASFIDKNWDLLFPPNFPRRRNWTGTISGTLSHHSPAFFCSGLQELGEAGWWKLALSQPPNIYARLYADRLQLRQQGRQKSKITSTPPESDVILVARLLEEYGLSKRNYDSVEDKAYTNQQSIAVPKVEPEIEIEDILNIDMSAAESEMNEMRSIIYNTNLEEKMNIKSTQKLTDSYPKYIPAASTSTHNHELDNEPLDNGYLNNVQYDINTYSEFDNSELFGSNSYILLNELNNDNIVEISSEIVDGIQETGSSNDDSENTDVETDSAVSIQNEPIVQKEEYKYVPLKSLFNKTSKKKRGLPWSTYVHRKPDDSIASMSLYHETNLYKKLKELLTTVDSCPQNNEKLDKTRLAMYRRLYRKLTVRQSKRQNNLSQYNLDSIINRKKVVVEDNGKPTVQETMENRVLDRFQLEPKHISSSGSPADGTFATRLTGQSIPTCFVSPFTGRTLKPFIRQDYSTTPLWLQLMLELQYKVNGKCEDRAPIDYSYVTLQHIGPMNGLAQHFFWPGIEMSEILLYPDFSVVAMYKKLIIGFGLLVPDVKHNEAYISFLFTRPHWERSGIGSFMLYHLIQTCMGKDITLHVSVTNPALLLYQKFGFKVEEFVQDFYDKYMPLDSKECRHALFLRLKR